MPNEKRKGQNALLWIESNILCKIKKKESIWGNLKLAPANYLKGKYRDLHSETKQLLYEGRENCIFYTLKKF